MIKLIDNNLDLYRPDKVNYLKSLQHANSLIKKTDKPLEFHCFWRVPRKFGRKQLAVLKSLIVNHDINNLRINLWSNVDLSSNHFFKEVSDFVNLKIWDIQQETIGTILEGFPALNSINDSLCYLEGDLFRLLVLHKYGGFYIDMDVLVLRDMSPLNNFQFLYQWGTSGFTDNEKKITMNGAVMRLNKNSDLSKEFLEKILTTPPAVNTTAWGNNLYSTIETNDLLVLPGIWFNSEWGFEGTEYKPFKQVERVEFFEGAFTWHWHNKWDDEIEDGSKFDVLNKIIEQKFKYL